MIPMKLAHNAFNVSDPVSVADWYCKQQPNGGRATPLR